MKGVFDIERDSPYGDRPEERYYLGKNSTYLRLAEGMVGDWILYRESKRSGGRKGYVGAARVAAIEQDPLGSPYARIADYFPFDPPIPLRDKNGLHREAFARAVADPRLIGREFQGNSVREISDQDFVDVVSEALGETLSPENLVRYGDPQDYASPDLGRVYTAADEPFIRKVVASLVNRKVRDANFRRLVCSAYEDRCAVTGLRIINGGGRSEAQAAHIWSVKAGGPDVIQNGIALSGTVHWLFDRHLISLTPDFRLLVADNRIPTALRGLFPTGSARIHLPKREEDWPHREYLDRHRDRFAGN